MQFDWNATMQSLRERVPQTQFQNWIRPVSFLRKNDKVVVLGVPSRFHEEWVRHHYSQHFSHAIKQQTGDDIQLEFEVIKQQEAPDIIEATLIPQTTPSSLQPTVSGRPNLRLIDNQKIETVAPISVTPEPASQPNMPQFSQPYFGLAYNHVATQCAMLFCQEGVFPLNSFYLCGGIGMGKTHLLVDIGQRILKQRPNARVRYVTAESFTDEWVRSIKSNTVMDFNRKYREETDFLLFDDVHGLTKRLKTQEALLHLYNEIIQRGGKVAFSSQEPANRLTDFIEPLKSRLSSSIFSEIKLPSYEEKVELLTQVARHHNIHVEPTVIRTMVDTGQKDLRGLIASLLRTHLQATLENRSLDEGFLAKEGLTIQTVQHTISINEIINIVEHTFGIAKTELFSKSRKGATTWARQVAMFLARTYTLLPLQEIGKTFGRDHATVIHAFQKVTETMKEHPTRRYEVEFIKKKLDNRSSVKSL